MDNNTNIYVVISTQTGHFLLTNLLLEKMKSTAKSTGIEGRIVNLSSIAHHHTYEKGICFERLNDPTVYMLPLNLSPYITVGLQFG